MVATIICSAFQGTVAVTLGRFKKALTDEMERELAQHCRDLDARFYGLTRKHIMKIAFDYADMNNVSDRFNQEKKQAGKDWLKAFVRRNNLSVRTPEQCSMARAMGFNKVQVNRFFENLKTCCTKYQFPAHRKYNMDETGISTVPNKTPKILTPKGKKTVCKISSAERGETVTAVCCMSATGIYVPPALIFPRKRMNHLLFKDAPPGTLNLVTETGYMNTDLFVEWLKHFVQHSKPSKDDPVLLIADNHSSHCSLQAVLYLRQNHVTFVTLPPHASHIMQPLDKGFFGPLKTAYAAEAEKWLVQHPGEVIKLTDIAGIFRSAYSATAKIKLAETAFKVTGIEPFDPDIIPEEAFAPSLVTDQQLVETPIDQQTNASVEGNASPIAANQAFTEEQPIIPEEVYAGEAKPKVSITTIFPLPKAAIKENVKGKRPAQKSEIVTSSPFKDRLEEKETEKRKKEEAKIAKMEERIVKKNNKESHKKTKKVGSTVKTKLNFEVKEPQPSCSSLTLTIGQESEETVQCPGCDQSFNDDWIQCGLCADWWHEACSAYEGSGPFICDHC